MYVICILLFKYFLLSKMLCRFLNIFTYFDVRKVVRHRLKCVRFVKAPSINSSFPTFPLKQDFVLLKHYLQ